MSGETPSDNGGATAAETAVKYRLTGDVQNVGFRNFLVQAATELSVSGWAKNESDGSLIVLLAGAEEAVLQMLPMVQQGPPGASVSNMVELLVEADDRVAAEFESR